MENTLFLSGDKYDYHTLLKLIGKNPQLGKIRVHDADGGYLLSFSECSTGTEDAIAKFNAQLQAFTGVE